MGSFLAKTFRLIKVLLVLALVVWGVRAWWLLHQAQRAGDVFVDAVNDNWPQDGIAKPGAREKLLRAAQRLSEGDFAAVVADLGPVRPLEPEEKVASQRFLADAGELRRRFIAVAAAAEILEEDGEEMSEVRDTLARAILAASKKDQATVLVRLKSAEAAVERIQTGLPGEVARGIDDADAVRRLVEEVEPAFLLGRELLTEGHTAAEKLIGRASWHYQAGEFRQAASLISLAAQLLGVEAFPGSESSVSESSVSESSVSESSAEGERPDESESPDKREAPVAEWFERLAESLQQPVSQAEAEAAVGLCEAMAMSQSPAEPVMTLVKKARRDLKSDSPAEARWWASVALFSLGMTEGAVAEATKPALDEASE